MFEQIWNPQTTGQKLISTLFMHPAYRDNASRTARKVLMIQCTIAGICLLATRARIKQLEAEAKEQHKGCIRMPKLDLPTFDFS